MAAVAPAEKRKEKPSALRSVIAGATAGAVEICEWSLRIGLCKLLGALANTVDCSYYISC